MRKTTEVLRLAAQGLSQRQIAAGAGVGKTTVAEYLARAAKAGISWPLPEGVDAEALDAALFPAVAAEVANRGRPVPDWRAVHRQLKDRRHHVTLRLLWVEWKADHPTGGTTPSSVTTTGPGWAPATWSCA